MSAADPIPAIREEDATGEIAAIFADLRATLGVPFVNLIWRHLATIPDALPTAWALLKPLYGTVDLAEAAASLASLVSFADLPQVPPHAWRAVGIDAADRRAIGALIAGYNRANGVNFLAMLVAASCLRCEATPGGAPGRAASAAREVADAIPLPGLDTLSPAVLHLVRDLDAYGRLGPSDAIASLYRHLAHWPPVLAMAHTALGPAHRSGELARLQERVIAAGRAHASGLTRLASPAAHPLAPVAATPALASIDEFTRLMIGRMIVMGAALAAILGPDS